jgi:hypothetical protein
VAKYLTLSYKFYVVFAYNLCVIGVLYFLLINFIYSCKFYKVMKKILTALLLCATTVAVHAQEEKEEEAPKKVRFKKENLFTGGSVTAAFFSGGTVLGISPYFGYSINRFVDVAAAVNVNYTTQRDVTTLGDKARQTVLGGGGFVRLFPVNFLFAHAQYEYNTIKVKYIPPSNSGVSSSSINLNSSSVLIGGGYCNGRMGTGDMFYYFSVMWDVKKDPNSPYTDVLNRAIPIVRAGLQIPLFQGGRRQNN